MISLLRTVACGLVVLGMGTAPAWAALDDLNLSGSVTEGAGTNTSYLIVSFGATTGNTYAFEYLWDTPTDGFGLVTALSDGLGDLDITATDFGSTEPNFFIDNVAFQTELGDASQFWAQWEGFFDLGLDDVAWTSGIGVSNIDLSDGLFIGLSNPFSLAEEDRPVIPVPEPTSAMLLLASVTLLATRRRKRVIETLQRVATPALALGLGASVASAHASPYAVEVLDYTAGTGGSAAYQTDGTQALGAPSRDAGFGSQTGVFYPPFLSSDLVTVGAGGQLTVRMGSRVADDPNNPFGIDLIVHGNALYTRDASGNAAGIFEEPGQLAVSANGIDWFDLQNVFADTGFATLGYTDSAYNGSGNFGGTTETDWQRPVDPNFDPLGKNEAQIIAGYNGSGGGTGIDLSAALSLSDYNSLPIDPGNGLPYIEYVRVSQPSTDGSSTEVQAFVNVPEPAALSVVALGGIAMTRRRSAV